MHELRDAKALAMARKWVCAPNLLRKAVYAPDFGAIPDR
jgi:hypothetical protein